MMSPTWNTRSAFRTFLGSFLLLVTLFLPSCDTAMSSALTGSPYGDGSAGSLVITTNTDWSLAAPNNNLQFVNLTIDPGVTLTLPSGVVIRCTESLTCNGIISVNQGALGGSVSGGATTPPEAGVAIRAAGTGDVGDASVERAGGSGGVGFNAPGLAASIRFPGIKAGGGGAGALNGTGGAGGGSLVVLARRNISIGVVGAIQAVGADGSKGGGGGAGGFVILAAAGQIVNDGTISVAAGKGGDRTTSSASGGGGSGGIIHWISPVTTNNGVFLSTEGQPGGGMGNVSGNPRSGGGGGGACYASAGSGGAVTTGGSDSSAQPSSTGFSFIDNYDPTSVFTGG